MGVQQEALLAAVKEQPNLTDAIILLKVSSTGTALCQHPPLAFLALALPVRPGLLFASDVQETVVVGCPVLAS